MCSSMKRSSCACSSFVRGEYSKSMTVFRGEGGERGRAASALLGEAPAHFGERLGTGRRLSCLLARRRAGLDALGDALQDAGDPEQVVREIEVPVGHHRVGILPFAGPAGALAVAAHIALLVGNAEGGMVEPADAAEGTRRDVPRHAVIAEV